MGTLWHVAGSSEASKAVYGRPHRHGSPAATSTCMCQSQHARTERTPLRALPRACIQDARLHLAGAYWPMLPKMFGSKQGARSLHLLRL